jgi:hypothetical protein
MQDLGLCSQRARDLWDRKDRLGEPDSDLTPIYWATPEPLCPTYTPRTDFSKVWLILLPKVGSPRQVFTSVPTEPHTGLAHS